MGLRRIREQLEESDKHLAEHGLALRNLATAYQLEIITLSEYMNSLRNQQMVAEESTDAETYKN